MRIWNINNRKLNSRFRSYKNWRLCSAWDLTDSPYHKVDYIYNLKKNCDIYNWVYPRRLRTRNNLYSCLSRHKFVLTRTKPKTGDIHTISVKKRERRTRGWTPSGRRIWLPPSQNSPRFRWPKGIRWKKVSQTPRWTPSRRPTAWVHITFNLSFSPT